MAARYKTAAAQEIANSTVTIVNFETEQYDTHDAVTVGAAWHFTAPVTGYYLVTSYIRFTASTGWTDTETVEYLLYRNGSQYSALDRKDSFGSGSSIYAFANGSDIVYLAAGDTIDLRVLQTSGAALALHNNDRHNYVSICLV